MTEKNLLSLDRLIVTNYRCFEQCEIGFHPELTVIVAENGHGKTAFLDAIGIAFGLFVETILNTGNSNGFESSDVHISPEGKTVLPTHFQATGCVVGQTNTWSRTLHRCSDRARSTTKDAEWVRRIASAHRAKVESFVEGDGKEIPILPLIAFYGTGRLWSSHRQSKEKRKNVISGNSRFSGYTDCLSSSSSFKDMALWFENKMNEVRDPRFAQTLQKNLLLLSAIKETVRIVLEPTGWCDLDWDYDANTMVVTHPTIGTLPITALSDGVRNMVALVADVARRCACLNPHFNDSVARQTPGILLIDEVDMHLHPRWQQLIVSRLQKAFPSMQMVMTTHSPHVLSAVDKDSIRVISLREGAVFVTIPIVQTKGVESADILARIMGVDPIPQIEEASWVIRYQALIQQNLFDSEDAKILRTKIEHHFGDRHPILLDCDRMIRLERFKSKLPSTPEAGGRQE